MDLLSLVAKLSLDSSEYEKGLGDAETKGSTFGRGLKKAAAVGASAVAAVGTAAIAAGTSLVKSTGDVAAYGDNIDKMSQKMGISAQAYQEWDAIMQHSGTSMGAMSGAFKTLQNAMAGPTDEQSMAFKNLGISSEIYAMKTEDAFNLVITKLQEMPESARRTAIAQKLLGRGAMEMGALLNTSAEDTQAMRDRVHELGGVMSDDAVKASAQFQDTLQDMSTGFDSLKRNMLSEFLPAITSVMDGLTNLFTGDYDEGIERISEGVGQAIDKLSEMLPKILEVGKNILLTLGGAIIKNLPVIMPALADLVMGIGQSIIDNLPMLVDTGLQVILQLANSISQALPTLIPTIVDVVLQIVDTLIDNVDLLVDASIALIIGLTEGIINSLPILIDRTPELVTAFVEAIIRNTPKLLDAAVQIISQLVIFLVQNFPMIVENAREMVGEFVRGITNVLSQLRQAGAEMINKVKDGLSSLNPAQWGADLVNGFIGGIRSMIGSVASAAGELASTVASYLHFSEPDVGPLSDFHTYAPDMMQEFAKGIRENEKVITDQINKSFDFGDVIADAEFGAKGNGMSGGNVFNINVYGAQGQSEQQLVDILMDEITRRTGRTKAVWA